MRHCGYAKLFLTAMGVLFALMPEKSDARQFAGYGHRAAYSMTQNYTTPSYPARSQRYHYNPNYNNPYYNSSQRYYYSPHHYDNNGPHYFYYAPYTN